MAIRDWPAGERPREKLLLKGAASLSEAELLAIFLRTGVKGKSAVDLARQMLQQFGSLRVLLAADQKSLCALPGLGPAKYAQLQAGIEMARRHLGEALERGKPLTDPAATRKYLTARFRDMPYEVFACLYLDNRHRVIAFEELFRGTIDGASVHPREVVRAALSHNGAAVIFAHQPPLGGGGTFRRGPAPDPAAQGRPRPGGYPGAGSLRGGGRRGGVVRRKGVAVRPPL